MSGVGKLEKKLTEGWGHALPIETPQNCVRPHGNYKA